MESFTSVGNTCNELLGSRAFQNNFSLYYQPLATFAEAILDRLEHRDQAILYTERRIFSLVVSVDQIRHPNVEMRKVHI